MCLFETELHGHAEESINQQWTIKGRHLDPMMRIILRAMCPVVVSYPTVHVHSFVVLSLVLLHYQFLVDDLLAYIIQAWHTTTRQYQWIDHVRHE